MSIAFSLNPSSSSPGATPCSRSPPSKGSTRVFDELFDETREPFDLVLLTEPGALQKLSVFLFLERLLNLPLEPLLCVRFVPKRPVLS